MGREERAHLPGDARRVAHLVPKTAGVGERARPRAGRVDAGQRQPAGAPVARWTVASEGAQTARLRRAAVSSHTSMSRGDDYHVRTMRREEVSFAIDLAAGEG